MHNRVVSIASAIRWDRIPGFKPPEGKTFDERSGVWIEAPKSPDREKADSQNTSTSPYYDSRVLRQPTVPEGFDAASVAEVTHLYSELRRLKADLRMTEKEIEWFANVRQQVAGEPELRTPVQELISGTGPKSVRLKRIDDHVAPIQKRRGALASELAKVEVRYAHLSRKVRLDARKYVELRLSSITEALATAQAQHDEIEALTYCCQNAGVLLSKRSAVCEFFKRGGIVERGAVRWYQQRHSAYLRWRDAVTALGFQVIRHKERVERVSQDD